MYQISPEEIFAGEISLLNVNFFSEQTLEQDDDVPYTMINHECVENYVTQLVTLNNNEDDINRIYNKMLEYGYTGTKEAIHTDTETQYSIGPWIRQEDGESVTYQANINIRSGYVAGTNTNTCTLGIYKGTATIGTPIATTLKATVAKWYYILRNVAIVAMMLILIYIGIRIILCSIASEKAKYKNMLKDWVIAMCLMFVMHYIMAFSMNINDNFVSFIRTINQKVAYVDVIRDENGKIKSKLEELEMDTTNIIDPDDSKNVVWTSRNLMGKVRIQAALVESGSYLYIGYVVAFLVLVWYTIFFLFSYIKRVLYLTFLTIIAPLVAMTYPIDKINDGKAQAFDMWLKEYIFNLLIQPVHLLLYTVLISSAIELAASNIIYTLVAIGFMLPAEKLLRRFFGFEKAQTPGMLGGAVGASLMMSGFNKLLHGRPPRRDDEGKNDGKIKQDEDKGQLLDTDDINPNLLFDNPNDSGIARNVMSTGSGNTNMNGNVSQTAQAMMNQTPSSIVSGDIDRKFRNALKSGTTTNTSSSQGIVPVIKKTNVNSNKNTGAPVKKSNGKKRYLRGIKKGAQEYARQKLTRVYKDNASGKSIRTLSKFATGAMLGAGAGIVGLSLGVAGGDPSKAFQYTTGSAVAGYALGSRRSKPNVDEDSISAEYEKGLYNDIEEYKKAKMEDARKQYISNDRNIKQIQEKLNIKEQQEAKKKLEEYGDCVDAGITDTDDIATIVKLVEEQGWSKDMAKTAAKYYKKAGVRPSKMGKKESENIDYIYKNIAKKSGITDEQQINQVVRQMRDNIDLFGSIKEKLDEV